jgi:hypothetical protein
VDVNVVVDVVVVGDGDGDGVGDGDGDGDGGTPRLHRLVNVATDRLSRGDAACVISTLDGVRG